jgi:hypothetical protein
LEWLAENDEKMNVFRVNSGIEKEERIWVEAHHSLVHPVASNEEAGHFHLAIKITSFFDFILTEYFVGPIPWNFPHPNENKGENWEGNRANWMMEWTLKPNGRKTNKFNRKSSGVAEMATDQFE